MSRLKVSRSAAYAVLARRALLRPLISYSSHLAARLTSRTGHPPRDRYRMQARHRALGRKGPEVHLQFRVHWSWLQQMPARLGGHRQLHQLFGPKHHQVRRRLPFRRLRSWVCWVQLPNLLPVRQPKHSLPVLVQQVLPCRLDRLGSQTGGLPHVCQGGHNVGACVRIRMALVCHLRTRRTSHWQRHWSASFTRLAGPQRITSQRALNAALNAALPCAQVQLWVCCQGLEREDRQVRVWPRLYRGELRQGEGGAGLAADCCAICRMMNCRVSVRHSGAAPRMCCEMHSR
jgi:hypothetical protein